ncbi:dephospho-CoA kinase [Taibaiella soli]|uniref:Dephospho-CoA kinase n=1 Tax=Taibaiella soli TaxID=1649169 RepID=A0A2W2A719_9BACT|nr:dephospho-CoA kinase [Taibaiella soli]PZF71011.1 dephospho-CoA kinase [Taibaiella soli]
MLKVGVTGGIGSGKSTVCQVFRTLGIPVFNADDAAKWLMENDAKLISDIKALFGEAAYENSKLNRPFIASVAFNDRKKLQALNALTHPATIAYGKRWMEIQTTPYAIKEAALFFESGSDKEVDIMIGVYAPQEVRIARAMKRDNISHEQVLERLSKQMNEEEKMSRCRYVITNDDTVAVIPQVLELHTSLIQLAAES